MNKLLLPFALISLLACSKSKDNPDDLKRQLTVNVMAVRVNSPYISNNWEVMLTMDKAVSAMEGNIIVQHDLWDLGQFKKTIIDTFDYHILNSNFFNYRTNRNANLQGPEIRNIKVNKLTQTTGNYNVTIR